MFGKAYLTFQGHLCDDFASFTDQPIGRPDRHRMILEFTYCHKKGFGRTSLLIVFTKMAGKKIGFGAFVPKDYKVQFFSPQEKAGINEYKSAASDIRSRNTQICTCIHLNICWVEILPCFVPTWILISARLILQNRRRSSFAITTITNTLNRVWILRRNQSHSLPVASAALWTCKCSCTSKTSWSSARKIIADRPFEGKHFKGNKALYLDSFCLNRRLRVIQIVRKLWI